MKSNSPDPHDSEEGNLDDEEFLYVGDVGELVDDDVGMDAHVSDGSDSEEMASDDAQLVFSKHTKSVFCGSIHPDGKYSVSGGEDDKAYIWNTETGEVLYECSDHSDSVIIASFSFDGTYVATADMAGTIQVRKCPANANDAWESVWEYQSGDLSWGFWHPAAYVLICGATSGEVYIWKIPSGDTKVLQGHGKHSSCGSLLRDGKRLAVGYDDGSLKIWDLKTSAIINSFPPENEESSSINALDTFHDNNVVIAGFMEGKVLMVKSATGRVCGTFNVDNSIETIKFSKDPSLGLVAIGTLEGTITIWDVARQTIRHKCSETDENEGAGATTLFWIDHYIVAAFLSGDVKVFDGKSGNLLKTLSGHTAEILDMTYSASSKTLLTTSEDNTCRIFKLDVAQL